MKIGTVIWVVLGISEIIWISKHSVRKKRMQANELTSVRSEGIAIIVVGFFILGLIYLIEFILKT
jgi:hypothetical protein